MSVVQTQVLHTSGRHPQGTAVVIRHVPAHVVRHTAAQVSRPHYQRRPGLDLVAPGRGVVLGEQHLHGHFVVGGVAVVGFPVGEGQLGGLDPSVQVFSGVVPHLSQVEALQDAQLLKKHGPLGPGRAFVDLQTPVIQRHAAFDGGVPFSHVLVGK